jgi:hypothetical protein
MQTQLICQKRMATRMLKALSDGLSPSMSSRIMAGHCTLTEDGKTTRAVDSCQNCGTCSCGTKTSAAGRATPTLVTKSEPMIERVAHSTPTPAPRIVPTGTPGKRAAAALAPGAPFVLSSPKHIASPAPILRTVADEQRSQLAGARVAAKLRP